MTITTELLEPFKTLTTRNNRELARIPGGTTRERVAIYECKLEGETTDANGTINNDFEFEGFNQIYEIEVTLVGASALYKYVPNGSLSNTRRFIVYQRPTVILANTTGLNATLHIKVRGN